MIRDPSDGSVREKPVLDTSTTGLALSTTSHQAQELARLERSRKWLSQYRTAPESVARLMGEGTSHDGAGNGEDEASATVQPGQGH